MRVCGACGSVPKSQEWTTAGAALLLSLTDPASLLLGLQRGAPPDCPAVGPPRKTEAAAPGSTPQKRRGVADRASHFYCKHPDCGKSYGCPDAVRSALALCSTSSTGTSCCTLARRMASRT